MKPKLLLIASATLITAVVGFSYVHTATWWSLKAKYFSTACDYPTGQECGSNEECIYWAPKKSICISKDSGTPPLVPFPRLPDSRTICTQGPRTQEGRTHSFLNTGYAVDLSSPQGEKNAKVRAVFSGKALVNTGCDNHDRMNFNNDGCGQGLAIGWFYSTKIRTSSLSTHT